MVRKFEIILDDQACSFLDGMVEMSGKQMKECVSLVFHTGMITIIAGINNRFEKIKKELTTKGV